MILLDKSLLKVFKTLKNYKTMKKQNFTDWMVAGLVYFTIWMLVSLLFVNLY